MENCSKPPHSGISFLGVLLMKTVTRTSLFVLIVEFVSWLYLLIAVSAWLLMRIGGDRWWLATMFMFGPRWVLCLPLLGLIPLAFWQDRRHMYLLLFAAVILVGPVMGLCLPFGRLSGGGESVRVFSCNVGGGGLSLPVLRSRIAASGADIIALQEYRLDSAAQALAGWDYLQEGELVIASRFPMTLKNAYMAKHPPHHWPRASLLQCRMKTPAAEISFNCVHLPSPRYGLDNLLDRHTGITLRRLSVMNEELANRRNTSQAITEMMKGEPLPLIVAGDFNMPVESGLYRQFWGDFSNAFSRSGMGYGWTEIADKHGFEFGVRIDHVLTRGGAVVSRCWVGPDVGSDHLPLLADIVISK
jgi:vancomycin resistance protein VanJ